LNSQILADQQWDTLITVIVIAGLVISVHKPGLHGHQLSHSFTTCGVGTFFEGWYGSKNCEQEETIEMKRGDS